MLDAHKIFHAWFTVLAFGTEALVTNRRINGLNPPYWANPLWSAGHLWLENGDGL